MNSEAFLIFLLAVAFDLIIGEPPAKIHPVVWIGKLISFLKSRARPRKADGLIIAIAAIIITVFAGHAIVVAMGQIPIVGGLLSTAAAAYLLKSTFAIRCLLQTSQDIGRMIDNNIDDAKTMLPALVGRETKDLTSAQAASAVIESVSENYVDTIISPIFYYLLFSPFGLGLEAALAFKAMSTMDSMLGYKTKGLKEIGYVPAKLDDIANYIPARLSIFLIALARPSRAAAAIASALRDHSKTPSPNSGWPMSACAGSLNVRLDKPGFYVLQDEGKEAATSDIPDAVGLIGRASILVLAISSIILLL
ncbi:MAG: cobalamin biosynthesis protein [Methanotrichaceae archaeon]